MLTMTDQSAPRRVIGIDLGGTKLAAGVISEDLVVHHRAHRVSKDKPVQEILDDLVDVVTELKLQNEGEAPIEAVAMGVPCLLDQKTGQAVMSVNLPIVDVPIRDLMNERIGLPVEIDNDGNLAALVEQRFGAAKGKRDVLLVGLGTGVAGGIIIGGKIFRGATGSGAEIGHMTVKSDGPRCQGNCPNYGCLETMVSGTAMGRDANIAAREHPESALGKELAAGREITGATLSELATAGDQVAIDVLAQTGFYLGVGLVSLSNIFNPEAIVIGGGATSAGDLILGPARETLAERGLSPNKEILEVVPAHFGNEAGMLGAGVLAFVEGLGHEVEAS
jgi:glucokinase